MTATRSTFYIGFAFVSNEREESYTFVLENLRATYQDGGPRTIISDKEPSLLRAIDEIFPLAASMIYIWHVMKNIQARMMPILQRQALLADHNADNDLRDKINEMWKSAKSSFNMVIFARMEEEKDQAWANFCGEYSDPVFRPVIEYIKSEWLNDDTAQRLLRCHTKENLHFDECASSRVEGAHAMIKRHLNVSSNDLMTVVQSIERTVKAQHSEALKRIANEQVNRPLSLHTFLYREVIGKVSHYALKQVRKIHDEHLPLGPSKKPIPLECTQGTRRTMAFLVFM